MNIIVGIAVATIILVFLLILKYKETYYDQKGGADILNKKSGVMTVKEIKKKIGKIEYNVKKTNEKAKETTRKLNTTRQKLDKPTGKPIELPKVNKVGRKVNKLTENVDDQQDKIKQLEKDIEKRISNKYEDKFEGKLVELKKISKLNDLMMKQNQSILTSIQTQLKNYEMKNKSVGTYYDQLLASKYNVEKYKSNNKHMEDELKHLTKALKDKKREITSQYGYNFLPPSEWNIPQKRPPPCIPQETCPVQPLLMGGEWPATYHGVFKKTNIGTILPKWKYTKLYDRKDYKGTE